MNRPSFNAKERARIFAMRAGVCYLCGGKVDGSREAWEIEHEIPWAISRDNSDGNLQVVHVKCHKVKTVKDHGTIAKMKRQKSKHEGTWPKTKTPLRSRGFAKTREETT